MVCDGFRWFQWFYMVSDGYWWLMIVINGRMILLVFDGF